jgi:hypothetical protein
MSFHPAKFEWLKWTHLESEDWGDFIPEKRKTRKRGKFQTTRTHVLRLKIRAWPNNGGREVLVGDHIASIQESGQSQL